jgi:hypothetical protein
LSEGASRVALYRARNADYRVAVNELRSTGGCRSNSSSVRGPVGEAEPARSTMSSGWTSRLSRAPGLGLHRQNPDFARLLASPAFGDEEGCASWRRVTPPTSRPAWRARSLAATPFGGKHDSEERPSRLGRRDRRNAATGVVSTWDLTLLLFAEGSRAAGTAQEARSVLSAGGRA